MDTYAELAEHLDQDHSVVFDADNLAELTECHAIAHQWEEDDTTDATPCVCNDRDVCADHVERFKLYRADRCDPFPWTLIGMADDGARTTAGPLIFDWATFEEATANVARVIRRYFPNAPRPDVVRELADRLRRAGVDSPSAVRAELDGVRTTYDLGGMAAMVAPEGSTDAEAVAAFELLAAARSQ